MKYFFFPDRAIVITSALCVAGICAMIIYIIHTDKWLAALPTALAVGLFVFFALKMPYCTYVGKDTVVVKQLMGSIKINDIKSIRAVGERELAGTVRILGNGGFLGYVGTFRSPRLGKFYMAAINKNELVRIVADNGKVYVVNYPHKLLESPTPFREKGI